MGNFRSDCKGVRDRRFVRGTDLDGVGVAGLLFSLACLRTDDVIDVLGEN